MVRKLSKIFPTLSLRKQIDGDFPDRVIVFIPDFKHLWGHVFDKGNINMILQ